MSSATLRRADDLAGMTVLDEHGQPVVSRKPAMKFGVPLPIT